MMERYDSLIIDTVNLAYKVFEKDNESPKLIAKKLVFKKSVCNFIRTVEELKKKYLHFDGQVYLLIDNYFSRADLQSTFLFADRKQLDEAYKATRKKENKSFYNSINLIRYYYLIGPSEYHTIRIDGLEADDLVKPLLSSRCKDQRCLMVTNDLDWCRYLGEGVDWLPYLDGEPETKEDVSQRLGFEANEKNLIIYKSFFGDESDNIPATSRHSKENTAQFLELINTVEYPEQLIMLARDKEKVERWPILEDISGSVDKEKRFLINIQLVSSIACTTDHLESCLTTGRFAETLYKVVRESIGLDVPAQEFVFGNVKRPRK